MALINSKIRESRSFLRLNQEEFAEKAGLTQFDVSALENDKKKFLPTPFLKFLVSKGIDLRKLLDDTIPLEEFRKDPTGNTVPSITESCTLRNLLMTKPDNPEIPGFLFFRGRQRGRLPPFFP